MKRTPWTKEQDREINEHSWLTPDIMTSVLNRLFKTNRTVSAVAKRQRKVLGFIPKADQTEY